MNELSTLLAKFRPNHGLERDCLIEAAKDYADNQDSRVVYNLKKIKGLDRATSEYWCSLAIIFGAVKRHDLEQQSYYVAFDIDNANSCVGGLVYTFFKLGNHEAVKALYQEILAHNPTDLSALEKLGNSCFQNGEYVEAVFYYEKFLELRPEDINKKKSLEQARKKMLAKDEKYGAIFDAFSNDFTANA